MKKITVWSFLVTYLLCGCASNPKLVQIPRGEPISISVGLASKADGSVDTQNDAFGDDLKSGAGGGAAAGALAGLTCGPLLVFCVPFGAVVGGVAGSVGGAAAGVYGALSAEQAGQLRERVLKLAESRDQLAELEANIKDRAARYWILDSADPTHRVTVQVQDLIMGSNHNNQVRSILRIAVMVQKNVEDPAKNTKLKTYEYVGPYSDLSVWLDEDSDFADTSLTAAITQISSQIVSDLAMQ
jgi:hypothetical protein